MTEPRIEVLCWLLDTPSLHPMKEALAFRLLRTGVCLLGVQLRAATHCLLQCVRRI